MVLAIDIGNSTVGLGRFDGEGLASRRLPTDPGRLAEGYTKVLEEFCQGQRPDGVVLCSVVPAVSQTMKAAIRRLYDIEPLAVSHEVTGALALDVETPATVGPDRIAGAAGAAAIMGVPVAVVDFGTATTVGVVTGEGEGAAFRGGAILPGINMQFRALSEHTAKLPMVSPSGQVDAVGRSTEDNIRSGVLMGTAGAVERLIREAEALAGDVLKVVVTGGMMEYMTGLLGRVDLMDPDLVLKGLKAIYEHERGSHA